VASTTAAAKAHGPEGGPAAATGGTGRKAPVRPPFRFRTLVVTVVAWVLAVIFIFPYLDMVITSLRPSNELRDNTFLPHHFQWSTFVDVWKNQQVPLGDNLRVTLIVAACATVLVLLVSLPAAYYTARNRYRGRRLFLLLVLVTQMFQPASLVVGLYREFSQFNLLDTIWVLILVNAAFNLAFAIWILTAYIGSIPAELEEAAMIDGTGRLGAMFRVTLPLAMPGVVTAMIFTFISAWNEFIMGLTLTTTPSHQPLTVGIDSFIGAYGVAWNQMFAGSVIAIIPVIILFAFIERRVVSGLTAGSVK
jgi:multiple sugar transport system permease protein